MGAVAGKSSLGVAPTASTGIVLCKVMLIIVITTIY